MVPVTVAQEQKDWLRVTEHIDSQPSNSGPGVENQVFSRVQANMHARGIATVLNCRSTRCGNRATYAIEGDMHKVWLA